MKRTYIYLILAVLCLLVYYNSLRGEFVSDDIWGIVENPLIGKSFTYWAHPSDLLLSLNYLIAGLNPWLFHLSNLLAHILVTIIVFHFLALFFDSEASLLGACLFGAHPVHTEAVSWISGRTYIIVALFIFLTLFLYLKSTDAVKTDKKFQPSYYTAALIIFTYYLYRNYAFYFLLPFLLVLLDLVFERWRRNWKWWLPFFGIVALRIILARAAIIGRVASVAKDTTPTGAIDWTNPIFNMAYSVFSHLSLLIVPARLTLYHEPPVVSLLMLRIEIILLVILFCALPFIFKKARPVFFAICVFILFLAPTYSPVLISWLVAERYLYFPSVSLSMLAAFCYTQYIGTAAIENSKKQKASEKYLARRRNALALFILIIAAYAARTVARNEDWSSPGRLWRSTVAISHKSPRSHNNMGDAYGSEGNVAGAIEEFKAAIELNPYYADAYHNLANTYHKIGSLDEAVQFYQKAAEFNPGLVESRINLGVIYINQGKFDLAIGELQKAQELRPGDQQIEYALSFAMQKKK